jgi:hypothetical protein
MLIDTLVQSRHAPFSPLRIVICPRYELSSRPEPRYVLSSRPELPIPEGDGKRSGGICSSAHAKKFRVLTTSMWSEMNSVEKPCYIHRNPVRVDRWRGPRSGRGAVSVMTRSLGERRDSEDGCRHTVAKQGAADLFVSGCRFWVPRPLRFLQRAGDGIAQAAGDRIFNSMTAQSFSRTIPGSWQK